MAQLTLTIPDDEEQRVIRAIATRFGYNAETDGTRALFARKQLARIVKDIVVSQERDDAEKALREGAAPEPDIT
jgi:hypothetical protein